MKNLAQLIQKHHRILESGKTPHGYPSSTISDLIEIAIEMKKEKEKWKKIAQARGKILETIHQISEPKPLEFENE